MSVPAARRTWGFAALLTPRCRCSVPFLDPDMYLPAFPAIARDFGASSIAVQQTLSIYLFAYGAMMLWHGALADRLGPAADRAGRHDRLRHRHAGLRDRRAASSRCGCSAHCRACSANFGVVIGRAVIRDRYGGAEAQQLMARDH